MKKSKLSNKTKIILTGIALLLSIVGTTYAWWTAQFETTQNITMGNLNITGNFPQLEAALYEPGTSAEMSGEIKNTGTIPALIRLENNSQIKFVYSDDALTLIPANDRKFVSDQEGSVQLSMKPTSGLYNDPSNSTAYWFKDGQDNTYLLLDPKGKVEVICTAYFDGDIMGARYQESLIQVKTKMRATQVLEGAIKSEFEINSQELVGLEDQTRAFADNRAVLRLQELVNR
ncbi:SipW-dependent-type signal peptide-containing protein [Enterococcus sp. LJL99]